MSLDADQIVDRRRLRRKLTFWRVLSVLIIVCAVIGAAALAGRESGVYGLGGGIDGAIARIRVTGLIRNNQQRVEALERLGRSGAKAVILHIDSPGGTTAGAEQLHDALIELRARKPLVVVVDGLAASGGYMVALAGERIVAQSASLVGSIGVLFQYPNVVDLLNTIGVKVETVKSSPLKAAPSGFEPTSPEARAAIASIVMDSYDWFKGMVKTARKLDDAGLARVSDGRVFTGRQALDLKLIDELGNEKTALAWLQKEKNIDKSTRVRDYSLAPRYGDLSFLHLVATRALDWMGLTSLARWVGDSGTLAAIERLNLDGLLALWHPPITD
jgi:protease-4